MTSWFAFQIVLLPVHVTLAWLFVRLTRVRRPGGLSAVEPVTIVTAVLAWLTTAVWMHRVADASAGHIWPHVLATAVSFLVFSAVLAAVWLIRGPAGSRNVRHTTV